MSATPPSATPTATIAGFQVFDLLGVGPLGKVYRAQRASTGEPVVFRGFHRPRDADAGQWQEAVGSYRAALEKHAAIAPHPNVQRLVEWGDLGKLYYLASEFFEGRNLQQILGTDGPRPLSWALPVFRQVGAALDHAHRAGVVHGDLTPFNVLVLADGSVKVINFGLAHVRDRGGSPFAAPEQLRGALGDARADVYGLAALLYAVLSGHAPFHGESAEAIAEQIRRTSPAPLDVPDYVNAVLAKALGKAPVSRYASCAELLDDLTHKRIPADSALVAGTLAAGDHREEPLGAQLSQWDFRHADFVRTHLELERSHRRERLVWRTLKLACAAALVAFALHATKLPARASQATALKVEGAVTLVDAQGQSSSVSPGRALPVPCTLRTGHDGQVVLGCLGSALKLGHNAELTLRRVEYSGGRVRSFGLTRGTLWARVDRLHRGRSRFVVWAGGSKVSVTGTRFGVSASPHGNTVTTLEGAVKVSGKDEHALVAAGQCVRTSAAGEPGQAESLPAEQLAALAQASDVPLTSDAWSKLDTLGELAVLAPLDTLLGAIGKNPLGTALEHLQGGLQAQTAVTAIVRALNMDEDGVPDKVDLGTLQEIGLPQPDREKLLRCFKDHRLDSYKKLGPKEFELEATSADSSATRVRYAKGKVQVVGVGEDD